MRRTQATISVIIALMDDPQGRHWGYDLSKQAGVRSGVLYPILHRMLQDGWLEDGWEDASTISGRPPRRYYKVTGEGVAAMSEQLAQARTDVRFGGILGAVH